MLDGIRPLPGPISAGFIGETTDTRTGKGDARVRCAGFDNQATRA